MNIDEAKKLISQEVFGMFKDTAVVVSAKESIDLANAIESLIDVKIKEALEPKQCEHKRVLRDEAGIYPDRCVDCHAYLAPPSSIILK